MSKKMIKQYKNITIFACLLLAFQTEARAQAGINTQSPKSTLDITAINQTSHIAGFIAPRITLADLAAKGNTLYGADQKGTIVYITAVAGGGNTGQRVNITSIGYFYFDGTVWLKFGVKQDAQIAGNIKESFKATDHKGWYLLDGRTIASLPAKAQAAAVSLGFAANLPDARDRVLKSKTGTETLGATGGSNSVSLTLANLPNLNLAGTFTGTAASSGAHTHALSTTSASTSHLHSFSTTSSSDAHAHTFSIASSNNTHTHGFSATSTTNGAHTHTYVMPTRQASSFIGNLNGFWNMTATTTISTASAGAHTHSFSGTSASGGAAHTHTASGTAASGGAAHTHTFSGTTGSGGAAHAHTFSGTSGSGGAAHTHAISGTANLALGTGTALNKRAAFVAVNTFVYLGE